MARSCGHGDQLMPVMETNGTPPELRSARMCGTTRHPELSLIRVVKYAVILAVYACQRAEAAGVQRELEAVAPRRCAPGAEPGHWEASDIAAEKPLATLQWKPEAPCFWQVETRLDLLHMLADLALMGGAQWAAIDDVASSSGSAPAQQRRLVPIVAGEPAHTSSLLHVTISGDSVSRFAYYSLLLWLFGCIHVPGNTYAAAPLPGLSEANRKEMCAKWGGLVWDGSHRVVTVDAQVPVYDATGASRTWLAAHNKSAIEGAIWQLSLEFVWARFAADLWHESRRPPGHRAPDVLAPLLPRVRDAARAVAMGVAREYQPGGDTCKARSPDGSLRLANGTRHFLALAYGFWHLRHGTRKGEIEWAVNDTSLLLQKIEGAVAAGVGSGLDASQAVLPGAFRGEAHESALVEAHAFVRRCMLWRSMNPIERSDMGPMFNNASVASFASMLGPLWGQHDITVVSPWRLVEPRHEWSESMRAAAQKQAPSSPLAFTIDGYHPSMEVLIQMIREFMSAAWQRESAESATALARRKHRCQRATEGGTRVPDTGSEGDAAASASTGVHAGDGEGAHHGDTISHGTEADAGQAGEADAGPTGEKKTETNSHTSGSPSLPSDAKDTAVAQPAAAGVVPHAGGPSVNNAIPPVTEHTHSARWFSSAGLMTALAAPIVILWVRYRRALRRDAVMAAALPLSVPVAV